MRSWIALALMLGGCGQESPSTSCAVRLRLVPSVASSYSFRYQDVGTCRSFLADGSGSFAVRVAVNNPPSLGRVKIFRIGANAFDASQLDLATANSQAAFHSNASRQLRPLDDTAITLTIVFEPRLFSEDLLPLGIDVDLGDETFR